MAPTPGDVEEVTVIYIDGMAVYKKKAASPSPSSAAASPTNNPYEANIPSVITTTLYPSIPAQPVVTAAFLINSYWNSYEHAEVTFTISKFNDLGEAAAAASSLQAVAAILSADGYPHDEMTSAFGSYSTPAPTSTEQFKPAMTAAANTGSSSSSSSSLSSYSSQPDMSPKPPPRHHGPPVSGIVVGVLVPVVVVIAILVISLFCIRHYKRKARHARAEQMAQRVGEPLMDVGGAGHRERAPQGPVDVRAHVSTPSGMPVSRPAPAASSSSSAQAQPIILSNTISDNYFTGIDTTDAMSVLDARPAPSERQDLHAETFGEDEPPPPYRPRSVPPISRDTSVRTSNSIPPSIPSSTRHDQILDVGPEPSVGFAAKDLRRSIAERGIFANLRSQGDFGPSSSIRDSHMPISDDMLRRSGEVRSPFDDPEDEDYINESDAASFVSTIQPEERLSQPTEALSDVSDLEYQENVEATRGHSSL